MNFRQTGFTAIQIILLVFIGIIGSLALYQTKPQTAQVVEKVNVKNESTVSATLSPSPSPKAPTPTPIPTSTSTPQTVNCNLTSNAKRIPPPANFYFTVSLINNSNTIKSVDWDINGDGMVDENTTSLSYSYTYQDAGDYTVKARVRLENGAISQWCSKKAEAKYHDVRCAIYPTPKSGKAPLQVTLSSGVFMDALLDEQATAYQWDFDNDGNWDTSFNDSVRSTTYIFQQPKTYTVSLQVKTNSGRISEICTTSVEVTN